MKKSKPVNVVEHIDETERIDDQELYQIIRDNKKIYAFTTFERAIPYYRDGLIQVYRRILWTMAEDRLDSKGRTVKSATEVGRVLAYHPHGDMSVYHATALLAQDFIQTVPLVKGRGAWGSELGARPAAARYTECKLSEFFCDATEEIDEHWVNFIPNYDDSRLEPEYIPFKLPVILINGTYGIAESYIGSFPCHNLADVCDICAKYILNKNITNQELVKGFYPDFPNYGIITNKSEIEAAYRNGTETKIKMKSTLEIDRENRRIYIKDLPYGVTIEDIRDILTQKNAEKHAVLSKVLDVTKIRTTRNGEPHIEFEVIFDKSCNILELAKNIEKYCTSKTIPVSMNFNYGSGVKLVNILEIVEAWYNTISRTKLRKFNYKSILIQKRAHILEGLLKVYDHIDEIVEFIKTHDDKEIVDWLMKKYKVTQVQAEAMADMKLRQISSVSKTTLINNIEAEKQKILELERNMANVDDLILKDIAFLKNKYKRERRTQVIDYDMEMESTTSIPISNGLLMYSYNQYAIFDLQNLVNGKNITNGLKSFEINGKKVKEICDGKNIDSDLVGLIMFNTENAARRIPVSEIGTQNMNNWILSDTVIKNMIPLTSEDDKIIIVMNNDGNCKFKIIEANTVGKQFANIGGNVILAQRLEPECDKVFVISSDWKYHYIDVSDIPVLGRSAAGVQLNIAGDKILKMVQVNSKTDENSLVLSIKDDEDQNMIMKIDLEYLEHTNRVNKGKKLLAGDSEYEVTNVFKANPKQKDSKLIYVGQFSSTQMSIQNFKMTDAFNCKKISVQPLACVQYSL